MRTPRTSTRTYLGRLELPKLKLCTAVAAVALALFATTSLPACSAGDAVDSRETANESAGEIFTEPVDEESLERLSAPSNPSADASGETSKDGDEAPEAEAADDESGSPAESAEHDSARARGLAIAEDYRESFDHGPKDAAFQKYIVLHDTEGDADAASVIDWWDSNGNLVAAHFIVNKDGAIWQCVPLDRIAHHAGYGDMGHNERYGLVEDGRDDMAGSTPIGSQYADYGMNAYSVGIEMVHIGGEGDYPKAQLEAVDDLIAYIDAYFGFESEIIDHKAWRSGNSDTSPEFADYLKSYQTTRRHG